MNSNPHGHVFIFSVVLINIIPTALLIGYPRNYVPKHRQNFGDPQTLTPQIKIFHSNQKLLSL
jgi:hypothetical protein